MKKTILLSISIGVLLLLPLIGQSRQEADNPAVSGQLQNGYRVLTVPTTPGPINYTVYRGDYIKFKFAQAGQGAQLTIPALTIDEALPGDFVKAPFFKMKVAGTYKLKLGSAKGQINVIKYRQSHYRELTVGEAEVILKNENPLLLDVRTRGEFQRGHLAGAVLIPVQELQRRIKELDAYKSSEILLYCATGNRSTVASKILIDSGFTRILNMRRGIVGWAKQYPVVR